MSRSYSYDSRSRISGISETIAGSTFSTTLAYDSYGRLSSRTHPSGVVETFGYNGNGYLSSVSTGGSPVYTITSMNARQRVTAATLSSSMYATYGFDSFGYPTHSKAGPYAMTSVTAPNGLIPNVNQFVGYTSFEKVDTIFEAPYKARILYNSENQRARMVVSRNDTTILK